MSDNKNAMRKLKLPVQMSIDGCIAGTNNEMDWLVWNWDERLKEYVNNLHKPVDTILLGRKMTNEFIFYWNSLLDKPDDPEYIFAKKNDSNSKDCFYQDPNKSEWPNTQIATGDLKEETTKLRTKMVKIS